MKRIIAAIVCVLMVFSFVGCSGNAGGEGGGQSSQSGQGERVYELTNLSEDAKQLGGEIEGRAVQWMMIDDFEERRDSDLRSRMEELEDSLFQLIETAQTPEEKKDTISLWIAAIELRLDMLYYYDEEDFNHVQGSLDVLMGKLGSSEEPKYYSENLEDKFGWPFGNLPEEARELGEEAVLIIYEWVRECTDTGASSVSSFFFSDLEGIQDTLVQMQEDLEGNEEKDDVRLEIGVLETAINNVAMSLEEYQYDMEFREKIDEDLQSLVYRLGLA